MVAEFAEQSADVDIHDLSKLEVQTPPLGEYFTFEWKLYIVSGHRSPLS